MKFFKISYILSMSLLLQACMTSDYYTTEQKRSEVLVHQLMERADQTFVREFDRLDQYCQFVINEEGTHFEEEDTELTDDYRLKVCQDMKHNYKKELRVEEMRRMRLEALMYAHLSKTVDRLGHEKRDFDGLDKEQEEIQNSQLNDLYDEETRVDTMMYEWSRVQKEMAHIQSLQACLNDRDFSQKWDRLLTKFNVKPNQALYKEACDIWHEDNTDSMNLKIQQGSK